jgi:hypothetical protein
MKFMRIQAVALLLLASAGAPAVAKNTNAQPEQVLLKALASAAKAVSPQAQGASTSDPDMGDDNASQNAIQTVCTKDTPAAQRSAICDAPESVE